MNVGLGRAGYPVSWEQTSGGDREMVLRWQRKVEREQIQEAANPELVDLRAAAADRRWRQVRAEHRTENHGATVHEHNHAHAHSPRSEIVVGQGTISTEVAGGPQRKSDAAMHVEG